MRLQFLHREVFPAFQSLNRRGADFVGHSALLASPTLRLRLKWEIFQVIDSNAIERWVLLVDDNPDDVLLIKRSFDRAGLKHPIHSVSRGEDAIAYLKGDLPYDDRLKYPVPDLVLLDIKMPGMDGFDVLRWIRGQRELSHLCVVMLTSSDEIRDVNQAYQLGANSFLVKPLDFWNAAELSRSLDLMLERTQH